MRAVQIEQFGGPEQLKLVEIADPVVGPGQILIRVSAAGVNFADIHQLSDQYLAAGALPLVPGVEVVGERVDTGERVVAYVGTGGYAELAVADEANCIAVPQGVSDAEALALQIQGLTAYHLIKTSGRLQQGESIVIHSAAGGVGSLATQLASPLGAGRVIATASTAQKCDFALSMGADIAVDGAAEGLSERLIEANAGMKVDVVLDMAGGAVFENSLKALAPFGRIVAHGITTREKNSPSTARLMRGSHTVVGFWFRHLMEQPQLLTEAFDFLFQALLDQRLKVTLGGTYPLEEAATAQRDLAARKTVGKLIVVPTA